MFTLLLILAIPRLIVELQLIWYRKSLSGSSMPATTLPEVLGFTIYIIVASVVYQFLSHTFAYIMAGVFVLPFIYISFCMMIVASFVKEYKMGVIPENIARSEMFRTKALMYLPMRRIIFPIRRTELHRIITPIDVFRVWLGIIIGIVLIVPLIRMVIYVVRVIA